MRQHPADWVERLTAALDVARRAAIAEPHNPMWPGQVRIIEVDLAEAVRRKLERLEIEANDRANNPGWGGREIDFHSGRASAFREAASILTRGLSVAGEASEQRILEQAASLPGILRDMGMVPGETIPGVGTVWRKREEGL